MCLSCFFWCVFFTYQNVFLCNFEKSYSSRFFFQDTTCNTDSYHVFRTFDWHPNPGQVSSQIISVSSCGVGPIDDLCFMCLLEIFQINADWDCLLEHVAQHTHTHTPEETHLFQFRCRGHLFSHSIGYGDRGSNSSQHLNLQPWKSMGNSTKGPPFKVNIQD